MAWQQTELGLVSAVSNPDTGVAEARHRAQAQFSAARQAHDAAGELAAAQVLVAIAPGDASAELQLATVQAFVGQDRQAVATLESPMTLTSESREVMAGSWEEWLTAGRVPLPIFDTDETKDEIAQFDASWIDIDLPAPKAWAQPRAERVGRACLVLKKPPAAIRKQPALDEEAAYCDQYSGDFAAASAALRAYLTAAPQALNRAAVLHRIATDDQLAAMTPVQQHRAAAALALELDFRARSAAQAWQALAQQLPVSSPAAGAIEARAAQLRLASHQIALARQLAAAAQAAGAPAWQTQELDAKLATAAADDAAYNRLLRQAADAVNQELAWLYHWPRRDGTSLWPAAQSQAASKCFSALRDPSQPTTSQLVAALDAAIVPLRQAAALFPFGGRVNRWLGVVAEQDAAPLEAIYFDTAASDAGHPISLFGLFQISSPTSTSPPRADGLLQPPFRSGGKNMVLPVRLDIAPAATQIVPLGACNSGQVQAWPAPAPPIRLDPGTAKEIKADNFRVRFTPDSDARPGWRFTVLPAAAAEADFDQNGPQARAFADGAMAVLDAFGGWTKLHYSSGFSAAEKGLIVADVAGGLTSPASAGLLGLGVAARFMHQRSSENLVRQAEPLPYFAEMEPPPIVPLQLMPPP